MFVASRKSSSASRVSVQAAIEDSVANLAGGLFFTVMASLRPGSVVADVGVAVPHTVERSDLGPVVRDALDDRALGEDILSAVLAVPNIDGATTGSVAVTDVTAAVVSTAICLAGNYSESG